MGCAGAFVAKIPTGRISAIIATEESNLLTQPFGTILRRHLIPGIGFRETVKS